MSHYLYKAQRFGSFVPMLISNLPSTYPNAHTCSKRVQTMTKIYILFFLLFIHNKIAERKKIAYTMRLSFLLHCQIGANMLHIARVRMLNSNQLRKVDISVAIAELEKGKDLLHNSIRFVLLCYFNYLRIHKTHLSVKVILKYNYQLSLFQ